MIHAIGFWNEHVKKKKEWNLKGQKKYKEGNNNTVRKSTCEGAKNRWAQPERIEITSRDLKSKTLTVNVPFFIG